MAEHFMLEALACDDCGGLVINENQFVCDCRDGVEVCESCFNRNHGQCPGHTPEEVPDT